MRLGRLWLGALLGLTVTAAGTAPAAHAVVVLNEVNCEGTDWVELVNTSAAPADLSGWLLTDDPLGSTRNDHRMIFSAATGIAAHGVRVVEKGAVGFPFGISCGSDTIRLANASEALVSDVAVPSLSSSANTWGRYPNGAGGWAETQSTKGAPNQPAAGGPDEDLAAWLFDPSAVVEIALTLPQASRDALAEHPNEYQYGTFALTTTGGTYGPMPVGIRLKGSGGSFRPLEGKAAFKVKFNHSVSSQRFLGLKKLTLNNMVQDPSMVREVLAYDVFRAAGVPAPRTGYAYVRLDGEDYGLYLNLETFDEISLRHWFDSTQHLYEGPIGVDILPGGIAGFEIDEGSEGNTDDLAALIAAVDEDGQDYSDRIAALTDLDEMTRMWATERYIGDWDSYTGRNGVVFPNNYFLHSDAGGRFSMLPWGKDQAFTWPQVFNDGTTVMFRKCLADLSCLAIYTAALNEVRGLITGLDVPAKATALAAELAPWQQADPRREYSLEQIDAGVAALLAYLADRADDLESPYFWLADDRVAPVTLVRRGPPPVVKTKKPKVGVWVELASNEPQTHFQCRLDGRAWDWCRARTRFWVGVGSHVLRARAIDAAGNFDTSPARDRWKVKRVRK